MVFNDGIYEQTVITRDMMKRLGDIICVAPWTELDLVGEFEIREKKEKRKELSDMLVQNRNTY